MHKYLVFFEKFFLMPSQTFELSDLYRKKGWQLTFERDMAKKSWTLRNLDDGSETALTRDNLLICLSAKNINLSAFENQLVHNIQVIIYQASIIQREATKLFGEKEVLAGQIEVLEMAKDLVRKAKDEAKGQNHLRIIKK